MAITVREIAWLSGLLEGEGSFRSQKRSVNIMVGMTDEDVIAKASKLMGRRYLKVNPRGVGYKPQYHITFAGRHAAGWMMTIYPLMGARRKEKIISLLAKWRAQKRGFMENVVCGHIDRPLGAKGRCLTCYEKHRGQQPHRRAAVRAYRAANKDLIKARRHAHHAENKDLISARRRLARAKSKAASQERWF